MKRFLSLLFAAVLTVTMTGCGGASSAASMAEAGGDAGLPDSIPDAADPVPLSPDPTSDSGAQLTDSGAQLTALSAALASYPAAAVQPHEDDYLLPDGDMDFDAYSRDYTAWLDQEGTRPAVPEDADRLAAFFRGAEGQFLSGGADNRACSPVNIYFALCMIAEVTEGESRAQVLRVLNADSMDAIRAQAHQIWNALYKDDGTSTLLPAASLWMREGVPFRQDTVNRLAESYYASSFSGNPADQAFSKALQTWLNQQTRGLLAEQAGQITMTPDTVLALASTLYFKSPWLSKFEEALTRPGVFHAPGGDMQTPYLHKTITRTHFYAGEGFTALPVSMDAGQMWLILPDKGNTVDALLEAGAVEDLLSAPERYFADKDVSVSLSLPKFDVAADLNLIDGLKALGVTDVFSAQTADFSPLAEDVAGLEISRIQHAARVKIDENGCEAAAFTVTMVELTAAMMDEPKVIQFTLDRPFLFVVAGEGNLPLFTGVVNVPEAA